MMELSLKSIVLLTSVLFTGLTAGLCFTWSNAVTPGIGRLDDLGFLQAFQAMNRAIINLPFMMVFMGPAILLLLNAFLFRNEQAFVLRSFSAGAALFFIGVAIVTVFKNVPLNEMLDKTTLESATKAELAILREKFERSWNRWHMVRTISSVAAFALLLAGILFRK